MAKISSFNIKISLVLLGLTAIYALLAAYYSYAGGGGNVVFAFCIFPFIFSLWVLVFTTLPSARVGFSAGCIILLAAFGSIVTMGNDPKAGQLWWAYLFLVPISAICCGLEANYIKRPPQITTELTRSVLATLTPSLSIYVLLVVSSQYF